MIQPEIKRLLGELKIYRKNVIKVVAAGLLAVAAQANLPGIQKAIFDVLQKGEQDKLYYFAAKTIGIFIIMGIGRYFHIYLMNYTGELATQNLRRKLQAKFMRLNLSFHSSYASGSGGLISRILNDIVIIQNGYRMVADFFREPLIFMVMMGWLFWLNWRLTLAILILLPIILLFLRQISKTIKTHSIKGQQELEQITSTIKESLDGVRVIQSFNLERDMEDKFVRESAEFLESRKKIHQRVELSGPVTEVVASAIVVSIIVYMGTEISHQRATFGDFMAYITAMLQLNTPIKKLQESYVRIQETMVAAKRVYALLDSPDEVPESAVKKPFPKNWKAITYKNVSFGYGDTLILKNINLQINRGQMLAFVGASGSGKSTLVNLLERFYDPMSGQILIDDIDIRDFDVKELRHNIGLVTQDVFLFSDTIERNIWAGDFTKPQGQVADAARSANAHNFIICSANGYLTKVGDRGNNVSGGEKQRISIARAIYKDAPILILDEATSALDSASEIEVQKGLDRLMQGRTVMVIAHRLSTVAKADSIVVMKAGEIVEVGSHRDLINQKGEYAHLYELQYQQMMI